MRSTSLPDSNQVPISPEIIPAATTGKLIIFVGNGLSRLYEIPSWEDLSNGMLHALATAGKITHVEHELLVRHPEKKFKISIADQYFKENLKLAEKNPALSYRELLISPKHLDLQKKYRFYQSLALWGCKFVTTNYDCFFADALCSQYAETFVATAVQSEGVSSVPASSTTESYPVICGLDKLEAIHLSGKSFLLHLHGSVEDEQSIVASTAGYLELYGNPANQRKLEDLFKDHTVLFLGYGLEELEILDLILRSGKTKKGNEKKFHLLLPLLSYEQHILPHLEEYYTKHLGVHLIPFCRDKDGYHSILNVLDRWAEMIGPKVQKPATSSVGSLFDRLNQEVRETT